MSIFADSMFSYEEEVITDEGWATDESSVISEETASEDSSTQKRKRGRKKKSARNQTDIRRSRRGCIPMNEAKDDYVWTCAEKNDLLNAIKKYGHLDLDHLCEAVPRKSRSAIEVMIIKWWRRASVIRQAEIDNKTSVDRRYKAYRGMSKKRRKTIKSKPKLAPIEQWMQELRKANPPSAYAETKAIAKAMLYISLFEKHPDPAECGGVDFSAVYDYLYRMLMGYPPKDLNEATTQYLLGALDNLSSEIKDGDFHSHRFHLNSVRKISIASTSVRQYSNSKKEERKPADVWMETLLKVPGFNPLSTPLTLLKQS